MIQIAQEIFQFIDVYAATKPYEKEKFSKKLPNFIENDKKTILVEDFNMVGNLFLDRTGRNPSNTHQIALQNLNKKNKHNLIDIWQKRNPHKRHFTYHNPDSTIHSRLDRTYIAKTITATTCQIIPTPSSDHDSINVNVQVCEKTPRGPRIWKLNTSILKHKIFQNISKLLERLAKTKKR